MVLVSSFGAMQNSRPHIADVHPNTSTWYQDEPAPSNTQSGLNSSDYQLQSHSQQRQYEQQPQHNNHPFYSDQNTVPNFDRPYALRRSSLEHFSQQPSSSLPSSSQTTSPTKSKMLANGFIVDTRHTHTTHRARRIQFVRNGYSDSSQDYVSIREVQNNDIHSSDRHPASSSTSVSHSQGLHAGYSTSSLIDPGQYNGDGGPHPSSLHSHSFSRVEDSITHGKQMDYSKPRPNGISRGNSIPANDSPKEGRMPTSVSLDSPYSSMTSLDTWSPNYMKLSFFMSSGDSDPIHNPVPRGSSDTFQRSKSSGHFRNLPNGSSGDGRNIRNINGMKSHSDYAISSVSESLARDYSECNTRSSTRSYQSKSYRDEKSFTQSTNNLHLTNKPSSNTHSFPAHSGIYSTLPRRGSCDHYLRRTVSHEPKGLEVRPVVIRTPSDGEIESEYVTLDRRYVPLNNSRLCRVAEVVVTHADNSSHNLSSSSSSNGSSRQIDHIHNIVSNNHVTNSDPLNASSSNLVIPGKSMHLLKTNTLPDPRRQQLRKKNSTGALRTVAETIGSVFSTSKNSGGSSRESGSPRSVGSMSGTAPSFDHITSSNNSSIRRSSNAKKEDQQHRMTRSKSLPDLQADDKSDENARNYSDDEDGDDFGFLSYPVSFSSSSTSAAMNKAKSPSPGTRIFPKRWRSKTKAIPSVGSTAAMWTPGPPGSCTWSSVSGRKVHLRPVSILSLTEAERQALQKIALSKLQTMDIGCPVAIPKENTELRRAKKSSLSLKRRSKSVSASALDSMGKDGIGSGLVFGIPLIKCVKNDRELEKKRKRQAAASGSPSSMKMRTDSSENLLSARSVRKSSSSSQGSLDNSSSMVSQNPEPLTVPSHKRAASSDSLSESESSRNTSSSLIDALSLSTSNPTSRLGSTAMDGSQLANHGEAQVPYVVKACFKHIETYGLQTLGIFRVGCSKKRVKQLREEFDSGKDVQLTEEYHPHDVGALLKEYFRDLPEPLLTRELYMPFLFAKRMKDEHKRHNAISLLISMLPVANRDTLWALLRFLATVSQHARDTTDENGETISGNKMDAHNLATLFGPNILHRTKATSDKEMMAESAERVEQSKEIIEVVKDMIDNHHELFEISGTLRDDVLRLLIESDQETADKILKYLANQNQIETDPESMCSVFEESSNSPMLHHSINSDADLLVYNRKQTTTTHRPLRVTKSADNTLDSPLPKSRITHLSESQAFSPSSRDNQKAVTSHSIPVQSRCEMGHQFPSPLPGRVPILRVSHESANPEVVLRGRLEGSNNERPYSEGFNQNLNIPRPLYLRENSSSSSGLSSSLNSHGGSDNSPSGHWVLPTPPASRESSPKPFFRSASSSSTLIPSPSPPRLNHSHSQDDDFENNPPVGSAEWERERWRHWEKIAAEKRNSEAEQETLV